MALVPRSVPARRVLTASAALLTAGLVGAGVAIAATPQPAIRTTTPRTERDVTNVDVDKQQVKNYYGDPLGSGTVGADSNYVKEVAAVEARIDRYLARPHRGGKGTEAIVLDVDDTTLNTWAFELSINFAFTPAAQQPYVDGQKFPAEPGMVDVVRRAEREGYAIFYLTGRGAAQEAATLGNLTADGVGVDAGYPKPTPLHDGEDGLFTKPAVAAYPDYLKQACAGDPNGSCTTIHYKSATRAHIESLGYRIVANVGDQYSDLTGGHAEATFKLPNPSYYLP